MRSRVVSAVAAWGGLWLFLGLLAACRAAPVQAVKIFCWDLTPAAKTVIRELEAGLGQQLPVVTAAGDYAAGAEIVRQLRQEKLRLLLVLGTPALLLTAAAIKQTPVVFALVADPYQTGAAYFPDRPEEHQDNITGLASPPPLAAAIRYGRQLLPGKRHWGLLYDPAEGAGQELSQIFARESAAAGLQLTRIPWTPAAGAAAAVRALEEQGVEVVFIPPDQAAASYAPAVLAAGRARRLLVINGNPRLGENGAVLSVTLDYEALGREAAVVAQQVLAGQSPKNLPLRVCQPLRVTTDEKLLAQWLGYPPAGKEKTAP